MLQLPRRDSKGRFLSSKSSAARRRPASKKAGSRRKGHSYRSFNYISKEHTPRQEQLVRAVVGEQMMPAKIRALRNAGITFNRYKDLVTLSSRQTWLENVDIKELVGQDLDATAGNLEKALNGFGNYKGTIGAAATDHGLLFELDLLVQLDNLMTSIEKDRDAIENSKYQNVKMVKVKAIRDSILVTNNKIKDTTLDAAFKKGTGRGMITTGNWKSLQKLFDERSGDPATTPNSTPGTVGEVDNYQGGSILQRIVRIGRGSIGKFEPVRDELLRQYDRADFATHRLQAWVTQGRVDFTGAEFAASKPGNEIQKAATKKLRAARQSKGMYAEKCGANQVPLYWSDLGGPKIPDPNDATKTVPNPAWSQIRSISGATKLAGAGDNMSKQVQPFQMVNGRKVFTGVGWDKTTCAKVVGQHVAQQKTVRRRRSAAKKPAARKPRSSSHRGHQSVSAQLHAMKKSELISFAQALM